MQAGTTWDGPTEGVKPEPGKHIVYINLFAAGGPQGVLFGNAVKEAASAIGWKVTVLDGQGTASGQDTALGQALALKPDGIILGSVDAKTYVAKLKQATDAGISVVGWHSAGFPGPQRDLHLFANISSDPATIGRTLADYAIADSDGTAKAIVVTDDLYAVAKAKAQAMKSEIEKCAGCELLQYAQAPVADIQTRTGPTLVSLYQRNSKGGSVKPYFLTITDSNYDFGVPSLRAAGIKPTDVKLLGTDGPSSAYQRVRKSDYQLATIPEPLSLQGWEAVDEMTRAFANAPWSGYTPSVYLVTKDNVDAQGGDKNLYVPDNDFKEHYKQIWGVQ
jgi:ribose transport system substrate-binding protein